MTDFARSLSSWPAAISAGTSRRPIAPLAPARKTRMAGKLALASRAWDARDVRQHRAREQASDPDHARQPEPALPAPHAMLLSLQRTAGNAAVGRLLARTPQEDTVKAMKATKGYGALSDAERTRIDTLIGGSTSLSVHAWSHMKDLLDKAGTDKDAAKTFKDFVGGKSWLNFDTRLPGEKRLAAAPFSKAGPTEVKNHPYRSGKADAKKTVVSITGTWPNGGTSIHEIPVFEPKSFTPPKPGRVLPSVDDMAKVLAEIPIQSRAAITRVDLHPKPNPDDAMWQADPKYNPSGGEFVSHMTAGSDGIVDVYPANVNANLIELETTLIHETGHAISNKKWGDDTTKAKWNDWRKARTDDGISVSTYGDSSDAEDFAESWMLFSSAYGTALEAEVRTLIPNRVKLMDGFMEHKPTPGRQQLNFPAGLHEGPGRQIPA
jgi:hypothetical protein